MINKYITAIALLVSVVIGGAALFLHRATPELTDCPQLAEAPESSAPASAEEALRDAPSEAAGLATSIPDQERAMTIPAEAIFSMPQALTAGNRVDLVALFPHDPSVEYSAEDRGAAATSLLLQNVAIYEVEHQGDQRSITVFLTPDEVELVLLAITEGQIAVAVRHQNDMMLTPYKSKTLRGVLEELEVVQRPPRHVVDLPSRPVQEPEIIIVR